MTYVEYCSICGYAKEGEYCYCDGNKKRKVQIDYIKRSAFLEMYLFSLGKNEIDFRKWIKSSYPEIEEHIFDKEVLS